MYTLYSRTKKIKEMFYEKKYLFILIINLIISINVYSQTVEYSMGEISFSLTHCSKNRALSNIDFFMESKPFYHFDIYQFNFNNVRRDARIITGNMSDLVKIYNGYSYGTIIYRYYRVNCIMYCNSKTGQYSLLQFADFNLGGGVVHQNLKRIFERSVVQVDNK